ncbi:MAG TPA: phosphate ABC transporter permease PstA [Rubrobacter sp.]|nr:phosphate ABC transporter permease PstA [Rubrobacter sp.]
MSQSRTEVARQSGPEPEGGAAFRSSIGARRGLDRVFTALLVVATLVGLVVLAILLLDVATKGIPQIDWSFIINFPSVIPENAGILPALVGTLWLLAITALVSMLLGVGAAIYLEEYAPDNWLTRLIDVNISNLAGVPSIVYGLLALGVFVQMLGGLTGGRSLLSGSLALSLLILPVIIIATREALRTIPETVREGGYALGATRWEVIRGHLLPMALPGALTGIILALSRAIGETAPLIVVGAAAYVSFTPDGPRDRFTAMPIIIFSWIRQSQPEYELLAAGGIVVLMAVLLMTNSVAIWLRNRYQRRV